MGYHRSIKNCDVLIVGSRLYTIYKHYKCVEFHEKSFCFRTDQEKIEFFFYVGIHLLGILFDTPIENRLTILFILHLNYIKPS